jgi:hypothetical protein
MFARRARSDAPDTGELPKRRRASRGWGPFSGGQLTIIVVTFAVLLLFPLAAFAVTGNNVFVTDATSGVRAKVDANGNLRSFVNGSVTATPTQPNGSYFAATQVALLADSANDIDIAGPPTGKALMLTSISVDVSSLPTPNGTLYLHRRIGGTACSNGTADRNIGRFTPISRGLQTISMPSGVPIPNGDRVCIYWSGGGTVQAGVMAYGYTVPAALCQSPNVCP